MWVDRWVSLIFFKEYLSTLDLRDGSARTGASMGARSHSVPGLDTRVGEKPAEPLNVAFTILSQDVLLL